MRVFRRGVLIGLVCGTLFANSVLARPPPQAFINIGRDLVTEGVMMSPPPTFKEEPKKLEDYREWALTSVRRMASENIPIAPAIQTEWGRKIFVNITALKKSIEDIENPELKKELSGLIDKFQSAGNRVGVLLINFYLKGDETQFKTNYSSLNALFPPPTVLRKKEPPTPVKTEAPKTFSGNVREDLEVIKSEMPKRLEATKEAVVEFLNRKTDELGKLVEERKKKAPHLEGLVDDIANLEAAASALDSKSNLSKIAGVLQRLIQISTEFHSGNEKNGKDFVGLESERLVQLKTAEETAAELARKDLGRLDKKDAQELLDRVDGIFNNLLTKESLQGIRAEAEIQSRQVQKFIEGDRTNPTTYYLSKDWFAKLRTLMDNIETNKNGGTGWYYKLFATADLAEALTTLEALQSAYQRLNVLHRNLYSGASLNERETQLLLGIDPATATDEQKKDLQDVLGLRPSEGTATERAALLQKNLNSMDGIIKEMRPEFRERMMAQFYSPWHTQLAGSSGEKTFSDYRDFFTAYNILNKNLLAKIDRAEQDISKRAAEIGEIKVDMGSGHQMTYSASDIQERFGKLGLDAKYQIIKMFEAEYGEDWIRAMDVQNGWAKFSVISDSAYKLTLSGASAYVPFMLSQVESNLMAYHPYSISQILEVISGHTRVFHGTNDFDRLTRYYNSLPKKISDLFTDIFDIKNATKERGYYTPIDVNSASGQNILQEALRYNPDEVSNLGIGRVVMDQMSKDVRVLMPNRTVGEQVYLYSPSAGVVIRLPRQIYEQFESAQSEVRKRTTPDIRKGPTLSPRLDRFKEEWFYSDGVEIYLTKPYPNIAPIISPEKLYKLNPDQGYRLGALTNLNGTTNYTYSKSSTTTETDQGSLVQSGRKPIRLKSIETEESATHAVTQTIGAQGSGQTISGTLRVNSAEGKTSKKYEKLEEAAEPEEELGPTGRPRADLEETPVPKSSESLTKSDQYDVLFRLRTVGIGEGSLLQGDGEIKWRDFTIAEGKEMTKVDRLRVYMENVNLEAHSVVYFERTPGTDYMVEGEPEEVPYYRVYALHRGPMGWLDPIEVEWRDLSKDEAEKTYGKLFTNTEKDIATKVGKGYGRWKGKLGQGELELEGAFLAIETAKVKGQKEGKTELEGKPERTDHKLQGAGFTGKYGPIGIFNLYEHQPGEKVAFGFGHFNESEKNFTVGRFYWSDRQEGTYAGDFWMVRGSRFSARAFVETANFDSAAGAAIIQYIGDQVKLGGAFIGRAGSFGAIDEIEALRNAPSTYGGHAYAYTYGQDVASAIVLSALYNQYKDQPNVLLSGNGIELLLKSVQMGLRFGTRFDVIDVDDNPDYVGRNFGQFVWAPEGPVIHKLVLNGIHVEMENDKTAGLVGGSLDFTIGDGATVGAEVYYPLVGEARLRAKEGAAAIGFSLQSEIMPTSFWVGGLLKEPDWSTFAAYTFTVEEKGEGEERTEVTTHQAIVGADFILQRERGARDFTSTSGRLGVGIPMLFQSDKDVFAFQLDPQLLLVLTDPEWTLSVGGGVQYWKSETDELTQSQTRGFVFIGGGGTSWNVDVKAYWLFRGTKGEKPEEGTKTTTDTDSFAIQGYFNWNW